MLPLPVWQMMEPLSGEREKMHLSLAMDLQVLGMGSFIMPMELPMGRMGIYMLQIRQSPSSGIGQKWNFYKKVWGKWNGTRAIN